ncbi:UvrD-helicase domain-containing protein [candidate division WOR-3 bacterium]|nr:UvrD-helicase domain-containing protein [candidate division WOR-3 bacterium]
MSDLLAVLNKEQKKAVQARQGPILILAGAGSGKTRVITHRIAYLIHTYNVAPRNILAITFTNKAADEMKHRVHTLLRNDHAVWIRTFHSTCAKILRDTLIHDPRIAAIVGADAHFTIYDEHDQRVLIKECLKDLNIDVRDYTPSFVGERIERLKQDLIPFDHIDDRVIQQVYELYTKRLREYNALDFGDLIMKVVELFRKNEATLAYYQRRFQHVMVDEYQDTNKAQYVMTKMLAQKHRNLCVVGDDDQSIYSWRGAEIKNILDFEKDFPEALVIKLEQNYRSTKTILHAASEVVKYNRYRKEKVLWCDHEAGEKINFHAADDAYTEAAFIARKLIEAKLQGEDMSRYAVFYRINYQSRIFEECFVRFQLPYEVVGALRFYERAEIKNVLAYCKVVHNPRDSVSMKRIINIPSRKIGLVTVEKVAQFARDKGVSLYEALCNVEEVPRIDRRTKARIKEFVVMIASFIKRKETLGLYELVMAIVKESGYLVSLSDDRSDADYVRRKNVEELLISIKDYSKDHPEARIDEYLADVSLRSDIDDWDESAERVNLMTLHNAKGLEFDTVFISGFEEGLIPHYKSRRDLKEYEEERRLLYVGITRARQKLYLTCARQRDTLKGGTIYTQVSPFLHEIPEDVFATSMEMDHEF